MPESTQYTRLECFKQRILEPYVMVRRFEKLPFFDERFINYGHNKIQWIEHLRYSGFEFNVLSHSYAVDIPHQS